MDARVSLAFFRNPLCERTWGHYAWRMLASLRLATSRDAAECLEIYRPFVESSHTTFETDVPSADAFARRIENYGATYPWIVSVDDAGTVTGAPRALRDCRAEAEAWIRGA